MKTLTVVLIVIYALDILQSCSAHAEPTIQIGQPCTTLGMTTLSVIQMQGILECIPDGGGNLFWQPMGAGGARYDNSTSCSTAGMLRWNGSAIQYCNGTQWQTIGGGNGKLYWDGNWTGDTYWCDPGYHITTFHYDCGCSNNTTWFECQPN